MFSDSVLLLVTLPPFNFWSQCCQFVPFLLLEHIHLQLSHPIPFLIFSLQFADFGSLPSCLNKYIGSRSIPLFLRSHYKKILISTSYSPLPKPSNLPRPDCFSRISVISDTSTRSRYAVLQAGGEISSRREYLA